MNKQELYDKINQLPSVLGWQGHGAKVMIAKNSVLELVRQLDEPHKVVIPQFVAEWIEDFKQTNYTIPELLSSCMTDEVDKWYYENSEQFMRAWLNGYTIEQEKLYTVEIPNTNDSNWNYTVIRKGTSGLYITKADSHYWYNHTSYHLTEAEIRQDFDWAWQAGFAKVVE